MNHSKQLVKFISGVFLIIFIAGQICGALAIKYYFLNSKMEELSPQLTAIAEGIVEGDFRERHQDAFIIEAYNLYGKKIELFNRDIGEIPYFKVEDSELLQLLPRLIAGEKIAMFQNLRGLPSKSIILGQPLVKDGVIMGGVFLLKPASDFRAALNGFNLVFFTTNLIGLSIIFMAIYFYLQKMKVLETTRRNYIANISHELRTPISSIKALTEPLCDELIHDEMTKQRYYHIIYSECTRLEKLISEMLELGKLQSGKMVLEKSVFDPNQLIQEIEDRFSILAEDIGITFIVTKEAKQLPNVYSNKNRILQVSNILIDNALKFTSEGSSVILDASYTSKVVKISIRDQGMGISKEDLPFVFERFYKGEKSYTSEGSGLGLSIAKEIMEKLGEKIGVESEVGKGSTFYFTIMRK